MVELVTEKLIDGGDALARVDGKVVFVKGALPKERVRVTIVEQKRDYNRAVLDELLEVSESRINPACPHFGECGGCNLQYATPEALCRWKEELCLENLARIGKSDLSFEILPPATGPAWSYRSRARFHVDLEQQKIGFLGAASHEVVPITSCPVLVPALAELLFTKERLAERAQQKRDLGYNRNIIEIHAIAGENEVALEEEIVTFKVGAKTFSSDARSFFQSNRFVLPQMIDFALSQARCNQVIDLYSGSGLFAAFLSQANREVIAVESDSKCLKLAQLNVGPHVQFFSERVESWRGQNIPSEATVIVDPPRPGLSREALKRIVSWKPCQIIYFSCNSVTLSRDVRLLDEAGYQPELFRMFDLYPQTSHTETALLLSRR